MNTDFKPGDILTVIQVRGGLGAEIGDQCVVEHVVPYLSQNAEGDEKCNIKVRWITNSYHPNRIGTGGVYYNNQFERANGPW